MLLYTERCTLYAQLWGSRMNCPRPAIALLTLLALGACSDSLPTGLDASPGRTFSIGVGAELALRVQNIGPGEYQAPPAISSSALRFLSVSLVSPPVPAGPTQLFQFAGAAPGVAIVTFQSTGISATIVDTVEVW